MSRPNVVITLNENDTLKFTLNGVNVSIANAIRRIILSDIPTVVLKPEKCTIAKNTSRLNNEIIKQRLGCVPVHINDMNAPVEDFRAEIKYKNDSDIIKYVTTENFRVFMKDNEITKDVLRKIFPANPLTHHFIDLVRLRPKLSNEIGGEEIDITCQLSIGTARDNAMYNVASTCVYGNTVDPVAINKQWNIKKKELSGKGLSKDDIEYEHKNWLILDSKRHFIKDSFDFIIQTLGVFSNEKLVLIACSIMRTKLQAIIDNITEISVKPSDTTIANSYDVKLENEDYTLGKVIEYNLYDNYYLGDKSLSFVGFSKRHPHDNYSIIRIALQDAGEADLVRRYITNACEISIAQFESISRHFN